MADSAYLFTIETRVPLADAEMSLHLAMFAVEGLTGRARVCLDAKYEVGPGKHVIAIAARNRVGRMIARVFAALLLREFGEDAFRIERVFRDQEQSESIHQPEEAHA